MNDFIGKYVMPIILVFGIGYILGSTVQNQKDAIVAGACTAYTDVGACLHRVLPLK